MTRLKRSKGIEGEKGDVRFGTPALVAEYRAQRLSAHADTIVEIGAGAGFQTRAFARHVPRVVAIEIDAQRLARAQLPSNATPVAGDALDPAVIARARDAIEGRAVVFLDPERPPASQQRTLAELRPDIARFLDLYSPISSDIAIELPPFLAASQIPWPCEREYLSVDGELNRLTLYMGRLARCEVSVVRLPSGERIEQAGATPQPQDGGDGGASATADAAAPRFILEPDRALAQAGLVALALPANAVRVALGKRDVFLSREPPRNGFFKVYEVLARGAREDVPRMLERRGCGTVILHGALSQDEHAARLAALGRGLKGGARLHVFWGEEALVARRTGK